MIASPHPFRQVLAWRWRRVAAGVVLLAAGALAVGVALPRAEPPPPVAFVWHADDGSAFRIAVPRAAAERFVAERRIAAAGALAAAEARLAAAAEAEAAAVGRRMMATLPAFADWLYGWVDSYVASYMIALQAAQAMGEAALRGEALNPVSALADAMQDVVGERFSRVVVAPADPAVALGVAVPRLQAAVDRDIARLVAADRAAWDAFLRAEGTVLGKAAAALPGCAPPAAPALHASALAVVRMDKERLVAMRFLRPYAARGVLVGLRAGIGEALSLPGGAGLGLAAFATPGALTTLAATTVVVWSADWMINHADALLHRHELEAALAAIISEAVRADAVALAVPLRARLHQHLACLGPIPA